MSNLSDLLPAGAGGKQVDFVATGTLSSGQTVALKTDGTVEAITAIPEAGTPVVFESASTTHISATFDSTNNKVVIAYQDGGNSYYGTAIVGTVSGTSISFGTPTVFESGTVYYTSTVYDSTNNRVVIAYTDGGNSLFGTAIVGTVSGTSISFGTAVVFESATSLYDSATFDSTNGKIVIAYRDGGNANYGTAVVGTVSGTSISFGTAVVFESAAITSISATFDSTNNKVVIAYSDAGNSSYGTAIVGTVSGTAISFGTPVVFASATNSDNSATYDSTNGKVVIAYKDGGNSSFGTAIVGTVSGTSISFGTAVVFESASTNSISATYDSTSGKVVIAYANVGNSNYGTAIVGTVSGTAISFGTEVVFESATSTYISAVYDSTNNRVVIAYTDGGNSLFGTGVIFSLDGSNNTSFIGITDAAISSAASGSVTIKGGISTNVTGLTANSTYYVQSDGTLSTASSSVLAGKALSATSINLDYTT